MHPLVVTALGTVVAEAVRHHVRRTVAAAPNPATPHHATMRAMLTGAAMIGAAGFLIYAASRK